MRNNLNAGEEQRGAIKDGPGASSTNKQTKHAKQTGKPANVCIFCFTLTPASPARSGNGFLNWWCARRQ